MAITLVITVQPLRTWLESRGGPGVVGAEVALNGVDGRQTTIRGNHKAKERI